MGDAELTEFDRDALTAYLQGTTAGSEGYVPKSGQIVGILKTMKDDFDKDLAAIEEQEKNAVAVYDELMSAKTKEVEAHTASIERKTVIVGELGVDIANMKNDLSDAESALIEDKKFLADLEKNCDIQKKNWDEIVKTRAMELAAIAETIKILNDDDALELFKKTLPSPSFVQVKASLDHVRGRALAALQTAKKGPLRHVQTDFIALALAGKKIDFSKVIKMIDDMVALLGKEQLDDNHKKEYCDKQFDFADDKKKGLEHTISDLETTIADQEEQIKTLTEDLKALADGIVALDKSVLDATVQRKKENAEYTELMSSNTAAKQLIEFAKNRLNKFYNPKLYKAAPKRELTEEEKMYTSMGGELEATPAPGGIAGTGVAAPSFLQMAEQRKKDDPGPPPETFGEYGKKSEESGGVIAMIDLLIRDLDKEMTEAETEEKDAQKDYEQMMDDAAKKRMHRRTMSK